MKILLVDDEQSLLDVFSSTLQTGGFQVVTAITGTEGIDKAKTEKPDMVLLDQVLPDINGNQVLQILKQDPITQSIPVAMLSNFNQDGLVQDAINLGAIDYILKYQIGPHDLVEKITQLMQENSTGTKSGEKQSTITSPSVVNPTLPSNDLPKTEGINSNIPSRDQSMAIPLIPPIDLTKIEPIIPTAPIMKTNQLSDTKVIN